MKEILRKYETQQIFREENQKNTQPGLDNLKKYINDKLFGGYLAVARQV